MGRTTAIASTWSGLAPASCQKTITSAAAMELLGPSYRYQTVLGYNGEINDGVLKGNLVITGSGDPTLGSWRYDSTKDDKQLKRMIGFARQKGIKTMEACTLVLLSTGQY